MGQSQSFDRMTAGKSLQVISIERPFSNFDFVDGSFNMLFPPLRRILSQVRVHAGKTMVMEDLIPQADIFDENCDVAIRLGESNAGICKRLSFFSKKFSTSRGLRSVTDDDFIGYAIVKTDKGLNGNIIPHVYESVVRQSRHENNFMHGAQAWCCRVGGRRLHLQGYLYAQQNNLTKVCAHAALRTACARFHPAGDMTYREMNQAIGINHKDRIVGNGNGLNVQQMEQILVQSGARCFSGDFTLSPKMRPDIPFQKYIYGSIESGYPAIVCFKTDDSAHTIPVFGHTFNEDTWVPSADLSYFQFRVGPQTGYIPSESWLNMYLCHDDNWGSNFCVPREYLRVRGWCDKIAEGLQPCPEDQECVAYVIGTLPKEVLLDPIRAEVIGAEYLFTIWPQMPQGQSNWERRLQWYASRKMLVIRPILIDTEQYVAHLNKVRDWNKDKIDRALIQALSDLPKRKVWLVEMSVPELFQSNRRKLADVLLWADVKPTDKRDFSSFVLARLPSHFALHKSGISKPIYRLLPSGTSGHVEMYGSEEVC